MAFDLKTVFTLLILTNIAIAFILIFYKILIGVKPMRLYYTYALGKILQASGMGIALFREELPGAVFIILSNIIMYYGISLEFLSFSAFRTTKFRKKLLLFLVLATVFSVIFALSVNKSMNIRGFISFLIFSIMGFIAGIDLLSAESKSKIKRTTGIIIILASFVMIFRSVSGLFMEFNENLFFQNLPNILAFTVYFIATFVLTISFIFLIKEEDVQTILRNSELLDNIIDNLPIGLEIFDAKGFCSSINKSMKDILALPDTSNVVGRFNILTDPFSKANGIDKRFRKVFDGESINHESTIDFGVAGNAFNTRKDKRVMREIVFPIFNNNHIVSHVVALIWDLTELKNKENELRQSQEKFQLVFESSPIGKALVNNEGTVLLINKMVTSLFGYTMDEIPTINEWYNKAYPSPELREETKLRWDQYKSDKKNHKDVPDFETMITNKDGSKKYVQLNFNEIEDFSIITFVDVSERKKNVDEIERIKELLAENERLFDVGAWQYNVEAKEMDWSDGLYNIHDFEKNKKIDHIAESLKCYSEEDRIRVEKAFSDCLTKGKEYNLICRFTSLKGKKKWVNTITRPVFSENNNVSAVIGVVVDISEHITTENKLKELNATKDKLFSIIGHDLRTPIGNLIQLADILIEKAEDISTKSLEEYILLIKSSSEKSFELLNNLLDWSRISIGNIELHMIELNMYQSIEEIAAVYQSMLLNKKITFKNLIAKDLILKVDEKMIQTVFRNLISNAIKFTPNGGVIEMKADKKRSSNIISISDNGIGMSEAEIEMLFNSSEFFSKDGTNDEKGTGLGFKLCMEFINLHHGSIKVKSALNKGTTFSVYIPVA